MTGLPSPKSHQYSMNGISVDPVVAEPSNTRASPCCEMYGPPECAMGGKFSCSQTEIECDSESQTTRSPLWSLVPSATIAHVGDAPATNTIEGVLGNDPPSWR